VDLVSEACFEPLFGGSCFCCHNTCQIWCVGHSKTALNRETDDSENVMGNETMLMRAIIGMFMKIGLLLESRN